MELNSLIRLVNSCSDLQVMGCFSRRMGDLTAGVQFWTATFRKFPVFFPGSREFRGRMVSARLRPPPRSLDCRETPLHSSENRWKSPHLPRFRRQTARRKCPAGPRSQAFEGFSLLDTCAVRFQRLHRSTGRMQCDHKPMIRR
jgi:hypothetical protein